MNINFDSKDAARIASLLDKSKGSDAKAQQLAENMAMAITKADKALRRCRAAEDVNAHDLAKIFYRRYQVLVGKTGSYDAVEQLAAQQKPLPLPDPEMEIEIASVKFVPKDSMSARPVVYFWNESTSNVGEMFMQRYTPKKVFLPLLDSVLVPLNFTCQKIGMRGPWLRFVKASWSQYAGCKTCPCSPGFILDGADDVAKAAIRCYGFDIHVSYTVRAKKISKAS